MSHVQIRTAETVTKRKINTTKKGHESLKNQTGQTVKFELKIRIQRVK